jgi:transcriptional regulator with XRE-family HTH domain
MDHCPMQRVSSNTEHADVLILLGSAIRLVRKSKSISQETLADSAGIDRSHMGRIERGERNVSILNIVRIAEALQMLPSSLLERAGI